MVVKVTVCVSSTDGQALGPGLLSGYDQLWGTVRKEGTASQLIDSFQESATAIAAKLKDNTATATEEIAVTMFLVELGAVKIEVLPVPSASKEANDPTQAKITPKKGLPKTDTPVIGNQQTANNQKRENDEKKAGEALQGTLKHEPASTSGIETISCSGFVVEVVSDESDSAEPENNSSDLGDQGYDDEQTKKKTLTTSPGEGGDVSKSPTERHTSQLTRHTRKKVAETEKKKKAATTDKSFPCQLPQCSSKLSTRRSLITHLLGQHKYDNEKAVKTVQGWYKPLKCGRPKGRKSLQNEVSQKSLDIKDDKLFLCQLPQCSSKLSTRHNLITHLIGQHKYDNEKAVKTVQGWYKPLKCGRPKGRKSLQNEVSQKSLDIKDEPASTSEVETPACSDDGVNDTSDESDFGEPEGNSSDTDDYDYNPEDSKETSPSGGVMNKGPTLRHSSRMRKRTLKLADYEDIDDGDKKKKEKKTAAASKQFNCRLSSCSAQFSALNSLITHLVGQHKYDSEVAAKTVKGWNNPAPKHRPTRNWKPPNEKLESLNVRKRPFMCEICEAAYPRRKLLNSHLCEKHEFTKEQSDAHIAKVYGVVRSRRSPRFPDSMFYSVEISLDGSNDGQGVGSQDGGAEAAASKPSCPKCSKEFDHVAKARAHFENDCTNNPLHCHLCGSGFESIYGYKVHMTVHKNKEAGVEFKCGTCGKIMYHKYLLTQHEATHKSNFVCDYCGKSFPQNCLLQRHRNKHTKEKVFACSKCPKVYYMKNKLQRHVANDHEGRIQNIACHICGKIVKECSIKVHISNLHSHVEYINCPICDKAFKRQSYLDDHTKEVHGGGGGEEYPCTWPNCGKTFVRKKSLKTHMDMHNDVRRFSCKMCDKKFRAKNHLLNHTNWHRGIRSHQCDQCEKSFLTKGNLTKHLATHRKRTSVPPAAETNNGETPAGAPVPPTIVPVELTLHAVPRPEDLVHNQSVELKTISFYNTTFSS